MADTKTQNTKRTEKEQKALDERFEFAFWHLNLEKVHEALTQGANVNMVMQASKLPRSNRGAPALHILASHPEKELPMFPWRTDEWNNEKRQRTMLLLLLTHEADANLVWEMRSESASEHEPQSVVGRAIRNRLYTMALRMLKFDHVGVSDNHCTMLRSLCDDLKMDRSALEALIRTKVGAPEKQEMETPKARTGDDKKQQNKKKKTEAAEYQLAQNLGDVFCLDDERLKKNA